MQLIFLSGGSGKRLWPLSNGTRAKQFLPLLESPNGTMESMIQRVVRQTKEAGLNAELTFATNASQRDSILSQIGENVGIVAEPERRDTFPAIALAASFLFFQKHCSDDEIVVVMPSDPYTEIGYFETITKMVREVEANTADLVLMGIQPDSPSEKYGYLVPASADQYGVGDETRKIMRFAEKPTREDAQKLLESHAVWNGGVFAFRLGYMMDIVRRYMPYQTFEEIRVHYSELPKISFDYEVGEKAQSVAMVPFSGKWKDLGTWNSLTEELHQSSLGNVLFGKNMVNTHVINELEIPMFCEGLKDMVVVGSSDGILVCQKDKSETIKQYVDSLTYRPKYEERRWGTYKVLSDVEFADGLRSLTKTINLHEGKHISYQIHHHRDEIWTIVDGDGLFVLNGSMRSVSRRDVLVIRKGQWHAIKAVAPLTFIEVQLGNPLVEEDIERTEWQW